MSSTNEVLCPDCNEIITEETLRAYGKCYTCHKREMWYRGNRKEYIPFRNLPESEKQRVRKNRDAAAEARNIKSETVLVDTLPRGYSIDEIKYIQYLFKQDISIKQAWQSFTDRTNKSICLATFYHLLDTLGLRPVSSTRKGTVKKHTREKVFTDKMLEDIKESAIYCKSYYEIYQLFNRLNPNFLSRTGFVNKIKELNIEPGLKEDNKEDKVKIKSDSIKLLDDDCKEDTEPEVQNEECEHIVVPEVAEPIQESYRDLTQLESQVYNNFNSRCKELGCDEELCANTSYYINALQLLANTKLNFDKMNSDADKQLEIINEYQDEMLHICEMEYSKEGDTSFQDALHIIRKKRRDLLYLKENLKILRPLLIKLPINDINKISDLLTTELNKRNDPIFLPRINKQMIEQYDWCKEGDASSTNRCTKGDKYSETSPVLQKNMKKYRVSMTLIGLGNGSPFYKMHQDYICNSEHQATEMGHAYIEKLKRVKNNRCISCTEMLVWQIPI